MSQDMQRDRAALLALRMSVAYLLFGVTKNAAELFLQPPEKVGEGNVRSCGVRLPPEFWE